MPWKLLIKTVDEWPLFARGKKTDFPFEKKPFLSGVEERIVGRRYWIG